jgi:putative transposase
MPRTARLVVPGYPHHVTQRGSRRQQTFFEDADYLAYLDLIGELKESTGVDVWAYCLMPNHIHVVAVPWHKQSLAKLFGIAHHRYAHRVNLAHDWRGHLWQERFHSVVMDDAHLLAAIRYVELNPVRAGLCAVAEDWRWSSVHAHLSDTFDSIVTVAPMRERVPNWHHYLSEESAPMLQDSIRKHTRTGRPAGDGRFIRRLEKETGMRLRRHKPGPKPHS